MFVSTRIKTKTTCETTTYTQTNQLLTQAQHRLNVVLGK